MIDIEIFKNFPKDIMVDLIDVKHCILEESSGDIDAISKQIWEGSRSIFSGIKEWRILKSFFNDSNCDGIKDILHSWDRQNIQTLAFYIPLPTIEEIRRKLGGRVNPRDIIEKIENSIMLYTKRIIPELHVCNIREDSSGIENIFNISTLKREFDKDTREKGESIYLLGLKYNLGSPNIAFYINNIPIKHDSGFIFGDSLILKSRLKKGFISVNVYDRDIQLDFNDTDSFYSKNREVNDSLQYTSFTSDRAGILYFELNRTNNPVILESQRGEKIYFSLEKLSYIEEPEEDMIERNGRLYMSSFFVPKDKDLKRVDLLLIKKENQNILVGGQYRDNLSCNILAEVLVDLQNREILVKNRSNGDLVFSDYNRFWKLEESSINDTSNAQGVMTDFTVNTHTTSADSDLVTGIGDITDMYRTNNNRTSNSDSKQIIRQEESFSFNINEIEFKDSNVSFDNNGVTITYTSFNIASFTKEFTINRMSPKISNRGTIIDCFLKPISRGEFESGGKVYDSHTDILGRAISSKPIKLKQLKSGLKIESQLDPRGYVLQVSTDSIQHLLGDREKKVLIKNDELNDVKIEIINKKYIKKPLLKLELKFNEPQTVMSSHEKTVSISI